MAKTFLLLAIIAASGCVAAEDTPCTDDASWNEGFADKHGCDTYASGGYWVHCEADGALEKCPMACRTSNCVVPCKTTPWTTWAKCSKECGGGRQGRTRTIIPIESWQKWGTNELDGDGFECGSLTEERDCNMDPCPIDCKVSEWTKWYNPEAEEEVEGDTADGAAGATSAPTCSEPCGGGETTRTREVLVQAKYGGTPCPIDGTCGPRCVTNTAVRQTKRCNVNVCAGSLAAEVPPALGACPALAKEATADGALTTRDCTADCDPALPINCAMTQKFTDGQTGCMRDCPPCVQAFFQSLTCEKSDAWSKWCSSEAGRQACCNTCEEANNGVCDDKAPLWLKCDAGTDCKDCQDDPNWGEGRWQDEKGYQFIVSAAVATGRVPHAALLVAAAVLSLSFSA